MPNGFSPIITEDQGTKETGFVIKNDTDDNEFVWIPVDETTSYKYERVAFSRSGWASRQTINKETGEIKRVDYSSAVYTEAMPKIVDNRTELDSVNQYKGFYIGRYEIGIIDNNTSVSTSNSENKTSWTGYTEGKAVSQKEKQVWNYITRDKAFEIAQDMYSDDDIIISKLPSSYAWDTALQFIDTKNSGYATNSVGGNYSGTLKKTGQTTPVNNIYDMGGNVYEYTTEVFNNTKTYYSLRGGHYKSTSNNYPAAFRSYGDGIADAVDSIGFRVTLFL